MYRVWSARSSDIFNKSIDEEIEGFINISCKADKVHRYLSTCTLTVFNETSLSPGSYKVQIINKAGDENFTVILTFCKQLHFYRYFLSFCWLDVFSSTLVSREKRTFS